MGRTRSIRAAVAAAATATAAATAAAMLLAGCAWTPAVEATTRPAPTGSEAPSQPGTPAPSQSDTSTPSGTATPSQLPTSTAPVTATPSATPTIKPSPKPSDTTRPRTNLVSGDSGPGVLALQQRLRELGYWLGTPDSSFGSLTQQAVWAFQKSAGLRRDGVVGPKTLKALQAGIRPKATLSGDGVEIDLDRQILLVVRGGSVRSIFNTSTGSGAQYTSTSGNRAIATTPRGRYTLYRAVDGPVTNSLGKLWRPRFFDRGIAVHGAQNIPPWPDSHGCARLSNAAIDMIWASDLMPIGSRVVVR